MKGFGLDGMTTTHGGTVNATQNMHRVDGKATLRVGDRFYCPQCKTISTLLGGYSNIMIFGIAVACIDDRFSCGARLAGNQKLAMTAPLSELLKKVNHTVSNQSNPYLHKTALTNHSVDQDTERLNGHYYNIDTGVFEGKITDEKKGKVEDLYACTGKYEEKGKDNYADKQKIEMTHTDFQKSAYILKLEAKLPGTECIYLGFAASNYAKKKKKPLLEVLTSGHSTVPKKEKGKLLLTTQTDTRSNDIRKGILQAQLDYEDPTKGATHWDGTDFLAWGLKSRDGTPHNKFEEYKKITIDKNIYEQYRDTNLKTYRSGKVTYPELKLPKGKILPAFSSKIPAQVFLDPNNWKTGKFEYITHAPKAQKNLTATVSGGMSIFWRID